MTWSTLIGCGN
ncbi:hypothetical protein E2C01_095599 [Portunus trituberculatus]|uniref:Uncharacterized protein n=1 Tax=Portunus trituberculatus TaxID=210409 RepID=A0A5B7K662_PORTR|nr:hypothetical protein [Portunus trituberculatus]